MNGSWAGHGVSVAVLRRTRSTLSGSTVRPPRARSRSPCSETISAATPTACGDAIDVPWIHWYSAHTPLAQLRTSGRKRGTRGRVAVNSVVPVRQPVGVDLTARLRHVERVGGQDAVVAARGMRRAEELAAVAAGRGDAVCSTP